MNSDCLVLKLEEVEPNGLIDTTLYILYDTRNNKYLIRGRRRLISLCEPHAYSYECNKATDLIDFIQYLFCPDNSVNEVLYSCVNLPEDNDEITFDVLNEYSRMDYEISGYNDVSLKRSNLMKILRMLKNVFNKY